MEQGQGAHRYHLSTTNPNDSIGGGGCVCSDTRCEDRGGPYAIFPHVETDNNLSPHVVACAPCILAIAAAIEDEATEYTVAGQPTERPPTPVDVTMVREEREPNPVHEDTWHDEDIAI